MNQGLLYYFVEIFPINFDLFLLILICAVAGRSGCSSAASAVTAAAARGSAAQYALPNAPAQYASAAYTYVPGSKNCFF